MADIARGNMVLFRKIWLAEPDFPEKIGSFRLAGDDISFHMQSCVSHVTSDQIRTGFMVQAQDTAD
ncbi:MAG: hypothetical protein ACLFVO_07650 [Chloroflexaceae bacterium]